jgi:hypothetical protein
MILQGHAPMGEVLTIAKGSNFKSGRMSHRRQAELDGPSGSAILLLALDTVATRTLLNVAY